MASSGAAKRTGRPSMAIEPSSGRSTPKRSRAVSVRPDPRRPAMPTAWPDATSELDALDRASAAEAARLEEGRLPGRGVDEPARSARSGPPSAISLPTILTMSSIRDSPATGYSPTCEPLRRTVNLSEIAYA